MAAPVPEPVAPPARTLTPDVVRFADGVVMVNLLRVDRHVTIEFRRAHSRGVQIVRDTLTVLIPDPAMAERHATVHSIPAQRLMVIHDHGSPRGTIMGGRKIFLESLFLPLSTGSTGVLLTLADTLVAIGQPDRLAPPTEATYDYRAGRMRTDLSVLTQTASEALRQTGTDLRVDLHRLANDTLILRAIPTAGEKTPTWHGALDLSLPDEELDLDALRALFSSVASHLRVFRPISQPTIHVALEWLTLTAFSDRLGPWVMEGKIADTVRRDGLIIFLSRGKGDSTDGFDWVVRPDGTAGALTDSDLLGQAEQGPKVILLLPWHDLPRARAQLTEAITRIHAHIGHGHFSAAASRHARQIFVGDHR